ncbi:hypothetical protein CISG_06062 [Coccidioides immitis RMSCC 3703]|uniref:Uncharacterized protein n=2 Tax=Coccidioides immitis TaxID=5501 RepID=A0A0J8R0P4_COCIT|nr:hypothetical protein CIRG_02522 [Coccidioides immitis RMSCC 2394]KMU77218.1 hypothetical protein CISG_06062 [Coccidioides immitis RMSCC 3703]
MMEGRNDEKTLLLSKEELIETAKSALHVLADIERRAEAQAISDEKRSRMGLLDPAVLASREPQTDDPYCMPRSSTQN